MKAVNRNTWLIFLLIFLINKISSAQTEVIKVSSSASFLEMRTGDLLEKNFLLDSYSMSRFMHNYSLNSLESWNSPSTGISIDDLSFSVLPFNFNSTDLLPVDLLETGEINLNTSPGIQQGIASSPGSINIKRKKIPDSLSIGIRGYFGSETGDPLIYTFTRPDIPSTNINKIPLSGSLSLSNGTPGLKYRFTLGYFGHFNSSSVNDQVMNFRNPRFYGKLDKQVLISGEAELNLSQSKIINFSASFESCYGWDIPPFIGNVIHFESNLYAVRTRFENILPGISFAVKNDGSLNEINGMTGIPPSRFFLMENSFLGRWNLFINEKLEINLKPEINIFSVKNIRIKDVPVQQYFFQEEFDKTGYGLSGTAEYKFNESFSGTLNLRIDKHFSGNSGFSISSSVKKAFGRTEFSLSASSFLRFPTVSDLSGRFQITGTEEDTNTYIIAGNNLLSGERLNYIGLLGKALFEKLSISAEVFLQGIQNPVIQKNNEIKRTAYPGDILRSAVSINAEGKKNYGLKMSADNIITGPLLSGFSYSFIENSESKFFPRHKISASMQYNFFLKSFLILSWFYRSSSTAGEFILNKEEDEYLHSGFDGKTPGYSTLNLSLAQDISPFYFINDLSFKISLENILDQRIKFFPVGNESRRTFIFFVAGRI